MYEKLDKLRGEVERLKRKLEEDRNRLKAAEQKLKNAENAQIIADVGALNLSPEQLAQFLQMVQQGGSANVDSQQTEAIEPELSDDEDQEEGNKSNEDLDVPGMLVQ